MSVRIGELQIGFDFTENAQAFCEARPAKGFHGGAVGFVVRGFEDVGALGHTAVDDGRPEPVRLDDRGGIET